MEKCLSQLVTVNIAKEIEYIYLDVPNGQCKYFGSVNIQSWYVYLNLSFRGTIKL